MARSLGLHALTGLPEIRPGDDLASLLTDAAAPLVPRDRDVVVVAQKVVSKAEGRYRLLSDVRPSPRALALARQVDKDPRLVELILQESVEVVRHRPGVLVVEHRLGFVMANAGIDQSNLDGGGERVLLLPEDPDASARRIRAVLEDRLGVRLGVVIADSIGRAWRLGTVGFAIGVAGLPALLDLRGRPDRAGRPLQVTEIGHADAVAAAAVLVMGEADEGTPAALVRGLDWQEDDRGMVPLLRPKATDLFR
jgi:coenzyme F420-0:L-glutamate ligase / coenzyme F420-1:gamma-L-glutamate ligase